MDSSGDVTMQAAHRIETGEAIEETCITTGSRPDRHDRDALRQETEKEEEEMAAAPEEKRREEKEAKEVGAQEYELVYTLLGHQRSVSAISISPDGTILASCGADGCIKLWSLATGALRATLRVKAPPSYRSEANKEVEEKEHEEDIGGERGSQSGLSDVAWSSDGRYLVGGGDDRTVCVWDALRVSVAYVMSREHVG